MDDPGFVYKMSSLLVYLDYVWPFLLVLTPLVFFHELGHYSVARYFGVKIEVFSIGFGPEIFGWYDRLGTRWKVSWIPLGGYVKMCGDADATSRPMQSSLIEDEQYDTMHGKTPLQKIAISFAGPFANYLLAVVCFSFLFMVRGVDKWDCVIDAPLPKSPAALIGFQKGDRILSVNDQKVSSFQDLVKTMRDHRGQSLVFVVCRQKSTLTLYVPHDLLASHTYRLGIMPSRILLEHVGFFQALYASFERVVVLSVNILHHVWGMLTQKVSPEGMGGVLMIVKLAGDVSMEGFFPMLLFFALLSVNLGLINLLPIPMLDGGHIVLYTFEMITGKKPSEDFVEWFYRLGLVVILAIFLLTTWNDSKRLGIVAFFERVFL